MPNTPSPASRGTSSRRAAPTKVAKPFPWGTVLGSGVLAVLLIGTIAFAALNQGSGRNRLLTDPDSAIEGVAIATGQLSRSHVQGSVTYAQNPPNAGDHNAAPQQCAVYSSPIAPEHAVHSLEHGAVWVTYNDSVPAAQIEELAGKVQGDPYRLMSPLPGQKNPIDLSAWGRRLSVDSASDKRVDEFLTAYTNGPQSPERGAACIGNTTTGPVQAAAPNGAILPSIPPVPSTQPSASPAAR